MMSVPAAAALQSKPLWSHYSFNSGTQQFDKMTVTGLVVCGESFFSSSFPVFFLKLTNGCDITNGPVSISTTGFGA